MKNAVRGLLLLTLLCAPCLAEKGPRIGPEKKIIKTGQDMPDAQYLHDHIREIENVPIDGTGIDLRAVVDGEMKRLNFRWWGTEPITEEMLAASAELIRATEFRTLTDNFLWMSSQSKVTPAPNWLDDEGFAVIQANLVEAAKFCRACGLKGIMLDTEQYGGMRWSVWRRRFNFANAHAQEKSLLGKGRTQYLPFGDRLTTFEEYAEAARRRGREIMSAMCEAYPEITFMVYPGLHFTAQYRMGNAERFCPGEELEGLASSDYAMLAPFGDGLLEGASPEATLVQAIGGRSYLLTLNSRFADLGKEIAESVALSEVPELYRERMKTACGLALCFQRKMYGGWHSAPDKLGYNHFSPKDWENALYFAMLHSDRYVWIWNQLNGAIFFDHPWREPEAQATVAQPYLDAMERTRESRPLDVGRDMMGADRVPIPRSAKDMPGYSDEETYGPLLEEYEIVADLPSEWRFHADPECLGIGNGYANRDDYSDWGMISIGDYIQRLGYRLRGLVWYQCEFEVPKKLEGREVFLLFGGVTTHREPVTVCVNGGWPPREKRHGVWIDDFTSVARYGEMNRVVVMIMTVGEPTGIYKSVKLAVRKRED